MHHLGIYEANKMPAQKKKGETLNMKKKNDDEVNRNSAFNESNKNNDPIWNDNDDGKPMPMQRKNKWTHYDRVRAKAYEDKQTNKEKKRE